MSTNNNEIDEEKEPTIKLDSLKDIKTPEIEDENFLDNSDKKYTTEEKFIISEDTSDEEEIDINNNNQEIAKEPVRDLENKKKNIKPIIIIAAVAVLVIVLLIVVLATRGNKEKESVNKDKKDENSYVSKLNKYLKSGSLDDEIKKALSSENINTKEIKILSMDIDSDDDQELVAYAEDSEKKYIFYFEVDEDIYLEDNFQVDSAQSIGYAYSLKDKEPYYYTEHEGLYTIIGYTKTVEKEESFLEKYFPITKEYGKTPILDNGQTYKLDKDLDVKKLDKDKITAESILEDNDTTLFKINEAANKYISDKEEAKRKQEEEEKAKKEAEEEAKKEAKKVLEFNSLKLHYGKYLPNKKGTITKLTFNEDGTGTVNDTPCTWKEDKYSKEESIPIIKFTCASEEYELLCIDNNKFQAGDDITLSYEE